MPTSYPGGIDNFTNPTEKDTMDGETGGSVVFHDVQHGDLNDAVKAIETLLGAEGAGVPGLIPNGTYDAAGSAAAAQAASVPIMVGLVADNGTTDNYTVIAANLAIAAALGGQCPAIPQAAVGTGFGVGTEIVVPAGVTLSGRGSTNSVGGNFFYGSTIVPMRTGSAPNALVSLANNSSSIQDLNVIGKNPVTGNASPYACLVSGEVCTARNVNISYGSTAAFGLTSAALQFIGSDIYVRTTATGAFSIQNLGTDGQITNLVCQANAYLAGGQNIYVNAHFNGGPGGTLAAPVITDMGDQIIIGGYIDTVTSASAGAMVDRHLAQTPSTYAACEFIQNSTNGVTGIPLILDPGTTFPSAGVEITGGRLQNYIQSGSQFTWIVGNSATNTKVMNFNCSAALTNGSAANGLTDQSFGVGFQIANSYLGTPVTTTIGGNIVFGGTGAQMAAPFSVLSNLNLHFVAKTGAYSLGSGDLGIVATANSWALTMPSSTGTINRVLYVANPGTGAITLTPSGTLDGHATRVLVAGAAVLLLITTAATWVTIAGIGPSISAPYPYSA